MDNEIKINVIEERKSELDNILNSIAEFLFKSLEEYGDPVEDIKKAMNYALSSDTFGGSIIYAESGSEIVGAVVMNKTGMDGYIPENILVYIAVSRTMRGKGIGKKLMSKAIEISQGNIALHVEEDNPAKFLYEKVGFQKKYAEMRLIR